MLVVWAGKSTMVERDAAQRLAAAAKRGSLIEIPDAEHQVILDSVPEVIRILREFLEHNG